MNKNRLYMLLAVVAAAMSASAQTSFDAAKIFEEELNGTARYVGMGGAMSALGNDLSVISHNPAGIATYHQSEVNATLSGFGSSVETSPYSSESRQILGYDGYTTYYSGNDVSDINMDLDNFSFVICGNEGDHGYVNFGFSYRRLLHLDKTLSFYESFLDGNGDEIWCDYEDHQRNKVKSFDFNISYNAGDLFHFGITLGLLSTDTWSEGYIMDYYADAPEGMNQKYKLNAAKMNTATGSGWNVAAGMIIRPIQPLRLGIAVKSPTLFKQEMGYSDIMYAHNLIEYNDPDKFDSYTDYTISSPMSINLSAGVTVEKTALGIEYEKHFVERASLSVGNKKMAGQGAIDYQDYSTFACGIEQNIGKLSLRAGYNTTSPMIKENALVYLGDSEFNAGNSGELGRLDFQTERLGRTRNFTLGLGYCSAVNESNSQFYLDVAYIHANRQNGFNLNQYDEDINIDYITKKNKLMVTMGWCF
ncbi:MAG: hypothetical protein IK006_09240 [Bacteroidaceae bacterium]|nr:hypothetical protein [Bacteroidaceae bacterium]